MKLDEKNCQILTILSNNCRTSLSSIAKEVNLSVDSVKKRIKKMHENSIFFPTIQLRPRHFGYPNIVEIKIKLRNFTKDQYDEFVNHMINHPRITEAFALSGDFDFSITVLSKDHEDLAEICGEIRNKFSSIISDWKELLTTVVYKFEKYDIQKLVK